MQKDMIPILAADGYEVSERELMRLRSKHGLLLRSANGVREAMVGDDVDQTQLDAHAAASEPAVSTPDILEAQRKRKERFEQLQADNDQKWSARKRRRHTKQWGDLPPDPPGPPRFPSEVTIGESQKYLGLDQNLYLEIREQFETISREQNLVKKTVCGPERWQAAKEQLIRGNPYLLSLFSEMDPEKLTPMHLCLDVICMDVSKRVRNLEVAMTLAEAKNVLGVNPEEGRLLRARLIEMLNTSGFISRQETGDWEDVKQQWLLETGLNQRFPAEDGPERERGQRALRILCRDMMKRWRDAQSHRDPNAVNKAKKTNGHGQTKTSAQRAKARPAQRVGQAVASDATQGAAREDHQIDPSLLLAANTSSTLPQTHPQIINTGHGIASQPPHQVAPIAAYFRLSPYSVVDGIPKIWLGALSSHSVTDLYAAAQSFPGADMYIIAKIEGVAVSANGTDMTFQIDQDDELSAYLGFVGGGKATFVVHLGTAF